MAASLMDSLFFYRTDIILDHFSLYVLYLMGLYTLPVHSSSPSSSDIRSSFLFRRTSTQSLADTLSTSSSSLEHSQSFVDGVELTEHESLPLLCQTRSLSESKDAFPNEPQHSSITSGSRYHLKTS